MPVVPASEKPLVWSNPRNPRFAVHWTTRIRQFPYGWYWRNFRWYRFFWYISAGMVPVMYGFHKLVNKKDNRDMWHHIHHAEKPMHFAPVLDSKQRNAGKGFPYFDPDGKH